MDAFKKHANVGHGGWKCPCCGPAPGKDRARTRRLARRRMKRETNKEIDQSTYDVVYLDELRSYSGE